MVKFFFHFSTNFAWFVCSEANRIDFLDYVSAVSVRRLLVLSKSPCTCVIIVVSSDSPFFSVVRHDDRSKLRVAPKMRSHCAGNMECVPMKGPTQISEKTTFSPEVLL